MKRGVKLNRILDRVVGIPLLNFAAIPHRKRKFPSNLSRIGVFCSPALGDTLLVSAALQDLRDGFPNAYISFFCTPQNRLAAELLPAIDSLRIIDITRPWRSIPEIRQSGLDLFVDFSGWQRITALHALCSGARFKVGFRSNRQFRGSAYDLTEDHSRSRHEIDNFRALVAKMGVRNTHQPAIKPTRMPPPSVALDKEIVIFHPWPAGAKSHLREWPVSNWIELAHCLAGPNRRFLITGGPSDLERSRRLAAEISAISLDADSFFDPRGLEPLIALLQTAQVVVSVNTGIMHLAAILGVRTVCINGPTSSLRWGPVGDSCISLNSPGEDCGFLDFGYEFGGKPTDCMCRITVSSVLRAVSTLWTDADLLTSPFDASHAARQAPLSAG